MSPRFAYNAHQSGDNDATGPATGPVWRMEAICIMRRPVADLVLCVAASAFLTAPALAKSSVSIKDVKLGKHVYGPDLDLEDLEGRVVLYEFWGMR